MLKRITNLCKIIVWVLLAGSLLSQSKEGLYSTDKNLIFKETLNSEYDCRRNGGTPTDVSFSHGKATFNNTSSFINYGDRLNFGLNSFSVKAKARSIALNETGTILAKRAATNNSVGFWITQNNASTLRYSIEIDDGLGNEVLCASDAITGNEDWHELVFVVDRTLNLSYVYVDGSSVVSADISIVGSINNSVDLLIGKIGAGNFFAGDLDDVEVYNYALTANKVLNLYQNKRYREFTSPNEILRVDARNGAIENKYSGNHASTEIITNGGFDSDTYWGKETNVTISDGTANLNASPVNAGIYSPSSTLTQNKTYRITFSITSITEGGIKITSGAGVVGTSRTSLGTYTEDIICLGTGATAYISFRGTGVSNTLSIDNVSIKEVIPEVTNTSTTVKRDGSIYAMDFNGSTSKSNCGSYHNLIGDISVIVWVKPRNAFNSNRILDNTNFELLLDNGVAKLRRADGGNLAVSANGAVTLGIWTQIIYTSTSTGVTNIYINGILSGSANQSTNTPVAGTNIIFGEVSGTGTYMFNGNMSIQRIYTCIITTQKASQIYTSEKQQYGM